MFTSISGSSGRGEEKKDWREEEEVEEERMRRGEGAQGGEGDGGTEFNAKDRREGDGKEHEMKGIERRRMFGGWCWERKGRRRRRRDDAHEK